MEPSVVVNLVERAIVVHCRIVMLQEDLLRQHSRLVVILRQEVVAVIRIRIAHA